MANLECPSCDFHHTDESSDPGNTSSQDEISVRSSSWEEKSLYQGTLAPVCLGNLSNIIMGLNKALRAILHLCSFFQSLPYNWGSVVVVQWMELPPHSSRHRGSILSSGYCSLSFVLPMSVWTFQLLHFPPSPKKTCQERNWFCWKMWMRIRMCLMPCNGLASRPGCISTRPYTTDIQLKQSAKPLLLFKKWTIL